MGDGLYEQAKQNFNGNRHLIQPLRKLMNALALYYLDNAYIYKVIFKEN